MKRINANKLIIPIQSKESQNSDADIGSFLEEAYKNALQFFEDKKENKEELISSSIFLYSLGDKKIYESLSEEKTLEALKSNKEKKLIGERYVSNMQSGLISAVQFRIKDRKLILDLNLYKKDKFENQLNKNYPKDDTATHLILNTFNEKLIYDTNDIDRRRMNLYTAISNLRILDTKFEGIIDNVNFQEKIKKDETIEITTDGMKRKIVNNFNEYSLDGYFKTSLKEWKRKLELSSTSASKNELYPKIEIQTLDSDELLSILVINRSDRNFIDEKTDDSDQVFECSWFLFENIFKDKKKELKIFKKELDSFMSRFLKECISQNLQNNIDVSTGEAADIARYWYREGIPKLFNEQIEQDTEVDVLDFYEKFIKDMLCEIDGIEETEIFPFDRVFIFPNTAVDDITEKDNDIDKVLVLEAHIKSLHPEDRGGYLSSWEGIAEHGSKPLVTTSDLKFSKKILSKFEWNSLNEVDRSAGFGETVNEEAEKPIFNKLSSIVHKENQHVDSNLLVGTLRLSNNAQREMQDAEENKLEQYKRDIRSKYKDGIYYSYDFGISLKDEFPMLYDLQNQYFASLYNNYNNKQMVTDSRKKTLDSDDGKYDINTIKTEELPSTFRKEKVKIDSLLVDLSKKITDEFKSKAIVVSFNPEDLKNEEESKLLANQKFTMIFVADFDLIKTNGELTAEEKDMEVLLNMLIRQITNNEIHKKEINKAIKEQNKKIRGTLDSAVHNIKSFVKEKETKDKIDVVLNEAMKRLEDTSSENIEDRAFDGTNIFNLILNGLVHKDYNGDINQQIISYSLPLDGIYFNKNISVLPKISLKWDDFYMKEAFNVILKNAIEYSSEYAQLNGNSNVILNMDVQTIEEENYLIVSITNNMKGITKSRFEKMNNESAERIGKDTSKDGSTGIGVAQSRIQLKGINKLNNIKFTMIDKHTIKCDMLLKIEKTIVDEGVFSNEDSTEETFTEAYSQDNFNGVLYLEDTDINYDATINFFKEKNIDHHHSVRTLQSHMYNSSLLITDMSILNESDEPDSEQGLEAIEQFRKLNQNNAPICVFSDGNPSSIQNDIADHLEIDKELITIVEEDMYNIEISESNIYVVSNTKIVSEEHTMILSYLNKLNQTAKTSITNQLKKKASDSKNYNYSQAIQFLDQELNYTKEFVSGFGNLQHTIQDKYFYIAIQSAKDTDIRDMVKQWMEFKAERSNKPGKSYSISRTTYHKNTLLIINDLIISNLKEQAWLFYFGLTYNIFFNFNNLSLDDILHEWSKIASKRESSGYLGKLRHDIKNFSNKYSSIDINGVVTKYIENLINTTELLQHTLKKEKYETIESFIEFSKEKISLDANIKKDFESIIESLSKIINFFDNQIDHKKIEDLQAFKKIIELNYQVLQ